LQQEQYEEVKEDEDEFPTKLAKVDQNRIFKTITELINLIKA
jgi:hypothetical protein